MIRNYNYKFSNFYHKRGFQNHFSIIKIKLMQYWLAFIFCGSLRRRQ